MFESSLNSSWYNVYVVLSHGKYSNKATLNSLLSARNRKENAGLVNCKKDDIQTAYNY